MKTKDLIRLLAECDPSGEEEVCVGNQDILFVDKEPAYYDGCLQVLVRDQHDSVIGAKVISKGVKVSIHTMTIKSALWDNPELTIEYDRASDDTDLRYSNIRKEVYEFRAKHR